MNRRVSGYQILQSFLSGTTQVDAVIVFTPRRKSPSPFRSLEGEPTLLWHSSIHPRPGLELDAASVRRIIEVLPPPRFEGYQARSLFLQDAFSPSRMGWYVAPMAVSKMGDLKLKVSARALVDLLAGRISPDQFHHVMGERPGEENWIGRWLTEGLTLAHVEIEKNGLDEDDDHLVLSFSDDPAARPLRLNTKAK